MCGMWRQQETHCDREGLMCWMKLFPGWCVKRLICVKTAVLCVRDWEWCQGLLPSLIRQKCKAGHFAGGWRLLWLVDGGRFEDVHQRGNEDRQWCSWLRKQKWDEKGPCFQSDHRLNGFKGHAGENFWDTGQSACGLFPVPRYYSELNWTESTGTCNNWQMRTDRLVVYADSGGHGCWSYWSLSAFTSARGKVVQHSDQWQGFQGHRRVWNMKTS